MKKGLILLTLMTVIGGTMLGAAGPAKDDTKATFTIASIFDEKNGKFLVRSTKHFNFDNAITWEAFFKNLSEQLGYSKDQIKLTMHLKQAPSTSEDARLETIHEYDFSTPPTSDPSWDEIKNNPGKFSLNVIIKKTALPEKPFVILQMPDKESKASKEEQISLHQREAIEKIDHVIKNMHKAAAKPDEIDQLQKQLNQAKTLLETGMLCHDIR